MFLESPEEVKIVMQIKTQQLDFTQKGHDGLSCFHLNPAIFDENQLCWN